MGPTFRRRAGKPHRVLMAVEDGLAREVHLPGGGFRVVHAFNDTSLVAFPDEQLAAFVLP